MIEILDVIGATASDGPVAGFALDEPRPGATVGGYVLKLRGWVAGRTVPPDSLRVFHEGRLIKELRFHNPRGRSLPRRVAKRLRGDPTWFWLGLGVLGLPPQFELSLHAFFERRSNPEIAVIKGRHGALDSGFQARRSPLMVTTLARTGSTWLMHLLANHPQVLVHRRYPYEMVPNRYWAHLLKVLSEPTEGQRSGLAPFHADHHQIGHHPHFSEAVEELRDLDAWFRKEHIERIAFLSQELTEGYYDRVALDQGENGAVYFAEKHLHGSLQWILWDLYPRAREVFLVRDPRDMVASMEAFNRKRGYASFGREAVTSDEEWLQRTRRDYTRLLTAHDARADRVHLLRYEDLVLTPQPALRGLFEYVGVASEASAVDAVLLEASRDQEALANHRTTRDPASSIGRWRELPLRRQAQLRGVFGEIADRLRYD